MTLTNNITDTALIFEGGGMRASYTSGFLNTLLENGLYFDYVAGISAGASNTVNYLSRDPGRAKKSFVDLVLKPEFGGWRSFIKGEGYFRAHYIYEETHYPDAALPLDFETFMANPARLRIGAFEMDSGIALDIAERDGFKKFFIVLSRPRGFRKAPFKLPVIIKAYFRKHPHLADALLNSHKKYNQILDELYELENKGRAFLVCPETMPVKSMETNYDKLEESYKLGYAQGKRDLPRWKEFLEVK